MKQLTSNSRKKPRGRRQFTTKLMSDITHGAAQPVELAATMGVSLPDLAKWVLEPANSLLLEGMLRLSETHVQLLVNNYKAAAVLQLAKMATHEVQDEQARKACVDLLRTKLEPFAARRDNEADLTRDRTPTLTSRQLLNAMERIGRTP
jgi:hypothetical protein